MVPWLLAFALTLIVEGPVVAIALRRPVPSVGRRFLLAIFANLATHPVVWFVFPDLPVAWGLSLALSEAFATGTETVFYRTLVPGVSWTRAVATSLVANAASFGMGLAVYAFLE
jgi:hypothetical protein